MFWACCSGGHRKRNQKLEYGKCQSHAACIGSGLCDFGYVAAAAQATLFQIRRSKPRGAVWHCVEERGCITEELKSIKNLKPATNQDRGLYFRSVSILFTALRISSSPSLLAMFAGRLSPKYLLIWRLPQKAGVQLPICFSDTGSHRPVQSHKSRAQRALFLH